jgi:paired amphipathic helix protein Sin3a
LADETAAAAASSQTPQPQSQKMPPLGSFAPPSSAGNKESKKRPRPEKQTPIPAPAITEASAASGRNIPGVGPSNKRAKLTHKPMAVDAPAIEPTLTPVMPEPFAPPPSSVSNQEELAFFDRVKKYLGNRATFTEFLKLCNLFAQTILDRNTLYHKGSVFLAANPELMTFWKTFTGYEGHDEVITNRPAPPTGKVSLSNCRGYGPSYRLLPKRVSKA